MQTVTKRRARLSGEPMCRTRARLVLLGALHSHAASGGVPGAWSEERWLRALSVLSPRQQIVVVLYTVRGMKFPEIEAWLGNRRGNAWAAWHAAQQKLRWVASEIGELSA